MQQNMNDKKDAKEFLLALAHQENKIKLQQNEIKLLKGEVLILQKQVKEAQKSLYGDILLISLLMDGGTEYGDIDLGEGVSLYALIDREVRASGNLSLRALPPSALANPLLSETNLQSHGLSHWSSRNLLWFLQGHSSLGLE